MATRIPMKVVGREGKRRGRAIVMFKTTRRERLVVILSKTSIDLLSSALVDT